MQFNLLFVFNKVKQPIVGGEDLFIFKQLSSTFINSFEFSGKGIIILLKRESEYLHVPEYFRFRMIISSYL